MMILLGVFAIAFWGWYIGGMWEQATKEQRKTALGTVATMVVFVLVYHSVFFAK